MAEQKRHVVALTSTLATVFTGGTTWGAGKSQIINVHVGNKDTVSRKVTLVLTVCGTDYELWPEEVVEAKSAFPWTTFLVLESGDLLKAKMDADAVGVLVLSGFGGV